MSFSLIKIPSSSGGGGGTVTGANNGLSVLGTIVQLGGPLLQDTVVDGAFNLSFGSLATPLTFFQVEATGFQVDADTINLNVTGLGATFVLNNIGLTVNTDTVINAPTTINSTLKIVDGTQQNGYVFTSDSTGQGSWQPIPILTADDGLSVLGTIVKLGQSVGQIGSPASLSEIREIPLNGFSVSFLTTAGFTLKVGQEGFGPSPSWHSSSYLTLLSDVNTFIFDGVGNGFDQYPLIQLANGPGNIATRYSGVIGGYMGAGHRGDLLLTTFSNAGPGQGQGGDIYLRPSTNITGLGDPTFVTQYENGSVILQPSYAGIVSIINSYAATKVLISTGSDTGDTLQVFGTILSNGDQEAIRTITANSTIGINDTTIVVDTTAGNITLGATPATLRKGRFNIKKKGTDLNTVTITLTAGLIYDNTGGVASYVFSNPGESITLHFDGTNAFII